MPRRPHWLRSDPEKLAFITAHCKKFSQNQMAHSIGVTYQILDDLKKEMGWEFKDSGYACAKKRMIMRGKITAEPPAPKHVVQEPPPPPPKLVRPPAVYSNSSPYGIADELHRSR